MRRHQKLDAIRSALIVFEFGADMKILKALAANIAFLVNAGVGDESDQCSGNSHPLSTPA